MERSLKKGDDETHGVEISIARKIEDVEHAFYQAIFFFFLYIIVFFVLTVQEFACS